MQPHRRLFERHGKLRPHDRPEPPLSLGLVATQLPRKSLRHAQGSIFPGRVMPMVFGQRGICNSISRGQPPSAPPLSRRRTFPRYRGGRAIRFQGSRHRHCPSPATREKVARRASGVPDEGPHLQHRPPSAPPLSRRRTFPRYRGGRAIRCAACAQCHCPSPAQREKVAGAAARRRLTDEGPLATPGP